MKNLNGMELMEFRLKMLSRKSKKTILISVGPTEDKKSLLPIVKKLSKRNISIFSTSSTHSFFGLNGLDTVRVYKVSQKDKSPNILELLRGNEFDLVINIRRGHDYDESSDSSIIRKYCVSNGIPLITDSHIANLTIQKMLSDSDYTSSKIEPWNMKETFLRKVDSSGGFACYHSHLDKAYLVSPENLKLGMVDMQKKWKLYKYLKENYTYEDLKKRMMLGINTLHAQGTNYIRTFVDADSIVGLLPLKTALEVKEEVKQHGITLEIAVQPLEGVINPESRSYFIKACEMADIIGGLPSRDRPNDEEHIDFIMDLANDLQKPIDAHIDQENNPDENETELLARKTIEHGLEGKVTGIHSISLASKPLLKQNNIISMVKDAGISIVICPSAALSMKQLENKLAPIHNSIAPLEKLLQNNIDVYLGVDNIYDLFMPMNTGDMWTECKILMEACRCYDIDKIVSIATNKKGFMINE